MILTAALAMAVAFGTPALHAQEAKANPCATPVKHHRFHKAVIPCDDVREQLKSQQAEIDALKAQLANQQPAAAAAPTTDPAALAAAQKAQADAADAESKADAQEKAIADLKSTQAGLAETVINTQKKLEGEIESPTALHYKGITIQPGGFVAAESVYRNRAFNSGIATPFNSDPYGNSGNHYISEFNGSARQSRLSLLATAPFSWGKASGYYEMDFLSAGTTSNDNQTNSYTMRVRTIYGTVSLNSGFSFQAGQMWTLATEVKKGILDAPGAETLPPTIDPNYNVGFDFGRQYGVRIAQSFAGGKANAAFAAEASQIIFTGSNAPQNFFFGGAGSGGGLYNSTANYSDNLAPDLHLKVTADPGLGHYELGGIVRFFRDRIYPQSTFSSTSSATDSTKGFNNTSVGGGVYASARVPIQKFADVALKVTYGKGIARYEASNLGDVTARPDGVLVPLKTGDGLFELDLHPTKKLDVYGMVGAEYLQRTTYIAPGTTTQVGYAGITTQNNTGCGTQAPPTANSGYAPGSGTCTGATRYILEPTVGFTYRFFSSPTKGRFQAQMTYSYLDRMAWQGYTNGTSFATATVFHGAQATAGIVETSFRYYIP